MPHTTIAHRAAIDPPSLTPNDAEDALSGDTPDPQQVGPDGTRTIQMPQAPGSFQEQRVNIANRASNNWLPGAAYAEGDTQKGGTPGSTQYGATVITSQGPDGVTRVGAAPVSPLKLAYGWSDYSGHWPTFVQHHLKIQWNANPNKPQLNPTPFNNEGPNQNTRYSTPGPWAAGTYIG